MTQWCLDVSRPHDGDWSKDDVIRNAVGIGNSDSGAGLGVRDMGFWFDTKEQAEEAERRVKAQVSFDVNITIWSSDA
jgi:hypothetical protein